jgi:hypothetical protein
MKTPCQDDPEKWFSTEAEERAEAMGACLECPALKWCREIAERDEPGYGVWGGKDYSPSPVVRHFGYCQRCGARFQHKRTGRRGTFCSQECYKASRATHTDPKVCGWCGKEFRRTTKMTMRQWESREFCSVRCGARANGAARTAAALARREAKAS